jgi:hypothetical protein
MEGMVRMRTNPYEGASGRELGDRVDLLGGGLLFLAIGVVALVPAMPDGAWLFAAGLVMLGMSAVRVRLRLAVHSVTVVTGVVALAAGTFSIAGFETSVWPLELVVLGVTFIIGGLYGTRRSPDGAPLAQNP